MSTMYTTVSKLVAAWAYFQANPDGHITTGDWVTPVWDMTTFRAWFRDCLNAKISRGDTRKGRCLTREYQMDLTRDGRTIREYVQGMRHTGCRGLLRTREMQRRFPHVNCQPRED